VSAAVVAPSRTSGHTILAFDYGEKHIGVAVGDTATRIAHPLARIAGPRALGEIDALVREWRPDELLVGMPYTSEGGEHSLSGRVQRFARQLGARYRLTVTFADERYSSTAAQETLTNARRGGHKDKHLSHALAASTVLQGYLDESARR
jgi:putative holliday junction resolvase